MSSPYPPYPIVPFHWDEIAIRAQLIQLRQQRPSLIPHFVDSIKERFIVGQDNRTAQARLHFMTSQIEQLKLFNQSWQLRADFAILIHETERNLKALGLEILKLDLQRDALPDIQKMEAKRDLKKLELEITQLDDQINKIKKRAIGACQTDPAIPGG